MNKVQVENKLKQLENIARPVGDRKGKVQWTESSDRIARAMSRWMELTRQRLAGGLLDCVCDQCLQNKWLRITRKARKD